ncbi:helix-hairpin-helix domain-containing protein [Solibacillus daqui]|uniref:helix-hairpin-helix domain-containing protein n=1 Tax=Solibacillus daqui TaxID=2912187 RepID=UPI0023668392|nr:helix-hairpin-helix domain-containing protein [Solibacillus daqui]
MQPFLEKYKKMLVITGSVLAALLFYFFTIHDTSKQSPIQTIEPIAPLAAIEPTEPEIIENNTPEAYMVDVKGAVRYPGVYTLEEGMRIVDAIEAAGGYTEQANPTLINHAQKLQDELVLYIPKVGEQLTEELEMLIVGATSNSSSSGSSGVNKSGKVNLNKANDSELTQLPGIGPSKANAIIGHRTEQGNFQTIEDLKKVTGIGEKTFEQLKELIDVK